MIIKYLWILREALFRMILIQGVLYIRSELEFLGSKSYSDGGIVSIWIFTLEEVIGYSEVLWQVKFVIGFIMLSSSILPYREPGVKCS